MNTEIVEIFKENGGYLTRKELQNGKQRYQLRRMQKKKSSNALNRAFIC